MSESTRVSRRQKATRERIIQCAMELFLRQGFEETSVAQITEAADIGKGTFFTYFRTKQDVLSFLGEHVLAVMVGADHANGSARARLEAVFLAAGTWYDENESAARQMVLARISSLGRRGDTSPAQDDLRRLFRDIVLAGRATGEFAEVDLEAAVTLVESSYFVPVMLWAWEPGHPLQTRLDTQLQLALKALEAR